jgi:micrococcal nuclease
MDDTYIRRARISRVVDGDTVDLMIDLGYEVWKHQRVRLDSMNAPEKRGSERSAGIAATHHLMEILDIATVSSPDNTIIVESRQTRSKDKYGRYVVTLYDHDGRNLNQQMVKDGHAVYKDYS